MEIHQELIKRFAVPPKIILFIGAAILIFATAFLYYFFYQKMETVRVPEINFEEINFPSLVWKNRILKNADVAASERDPSKRFELYQNIFGDLLAIYQRDHNPKTRMQAETLAKFVKEEFPDIYISERFTVPCLDSTCGTPNFPKDILDIKEKLKDISAFDPLVLDSINKKLEAAALSEERWFQWDQYFGALQEIVVEKRRTEDEEIGMVARMLQKFLQENYGEEYKKIEELFPEAVKL